MYRLAKLAKLGARPALRVAAQRTYAKELKFGGQAREEMLAGGKIV